jgi:predicted DNA-binding protein
METLSIQLESETRANLDRLRLQHELKPSRSMYIRGLIERHVAELTGKAPQAYADAEGPKPK